MFVVSSPEPEVAVTSRQAVLVLLLLDYLVVMAAEQHHLVYGCFSLKGNHSCICGVQISKAKESAEGVHMLAPCFVVLCTLLFLFQHCMTDPCFWCPHSPRLL